MGGVASAGPCRGGAVPAPTHGHASATYAAQTGRFLPGLGRLDGPTHKSRVQASATATDPPTDSASPSSGDRELIECVALA